MKTVRSSTGDTITDDTATRDLRALSQGGVLVAVGQKRGRHYEPGDTLRAVWSNIRNRRPTRGVDDPYALVEGR